MPTLPRRRRTASDRSAILLTVAATLLAAVAVSIPHGALAMSVPGGIVRAAGAGHAQIVPMSSSLHPFSPGIVVTLGADRTTAVQNHAFNLTVTTSPAPSPSYQLRWTNLPSPCSGSAPTTVTVSPYSWSCTPSQTGSFSIVVNASNASVSGQSTPVAVTVDAQLQLTLSLSQYTVTVNSQVTFHYQVTGGESPYSIQWMGLPSSCNGPAPNTDPDSNPQTWSCTPTQTGNTQVQFQATDHATPSQFRSSNSQSLSVTSNSNNNGSKGNNSNGSFQLPAFFSGIGSLLALAFIAGLVAFILLIITAVSTLVTAIIVARRLPPRSKAEPKPATIACPSCGKPAPVDSTFCPSCGKPTAAPKTA